MKPLTTFAFHDLGSTRNLTNSSQTITDAYTYKAFGEIPASSGSTTNPFRYIGAFNYYKDADSTFLMLGARYYAPQWGRFMTVDPEEQGRNWFQYAGGTPGARVDPSGLWDRYCGADTPVGPAYLKTTIHVYTFMGYECGGICTAPDGTPGRWVRFYVQHTILNQWCRQCRKPDGSLYVGCAWDPPKVFRGFVRLCVTGATLGYLCGSGPGAVGGGFRPSPVSYPPIVFVDRPPKGAVTK